MRVLITGASGFVGRHLVESLQRDGFSNLLITGKDSVEHPVIGRVQALDVTDRDAVDAAISGFRPERIVHLAGIAAPMLANAAPQTTWRVHVTGTLNLAWSILQHTPDCVLLSVGSGLVYGATAIEVAALDESALLAPLDDYAASKAAADLALGAMSHSKLRCIRLRPFNHTGPGQEEAFMVPSFAMQIARIEAGLQPPLMRVGNLDAIRDLLDVRDVADSYARGVAHADAVPTGTILNISSGTGVQVGDVLERLLQLGSLKITVEHDPARSRPADLPRVVGNSSRARELLGWNPKYTLDETLHAVLDECRQRVAHHRN